MAPAGLERQRDVPVHARLDLQLRHPVRCTISGRAPSALPLRRLVSFGDLHRHHQQPVEPHPEAASSATRGSATRPPTRIGKSPLEVQNVFDKYYFMSVSDITRSLGAVTAVPALPRTWALSVKRNFGLNRDDAPATSRRRRAGSASATYKQCLTVGGPDGLRCPPPPARNPPAPASRGPASAADATCTGRAARAIAPPFPWRTWCARNANGPHAAGRHVAGGRSIGVEALAHFLAGLEVGHPLRGHVDRIAGARVAAGAGVAQPGRESAEARAARPGRLRPAARRSRRRRYRPPARPLRAAGRDCPRTALAEARI